MEKSFECECGNNLFWFFWDSVRCTGCYNEYKKTILSFTQPDPHKFTYPREEYWMRRFNKKENKYDENWEKSPITFK